METGGSLLLERVRRVDCRAYRLKRLILWAIEGAGVAAVPGFAL